jgi:uncharacterized protein (TIGR02099 family)
MKRLLRVAEILAWTVFFAVAVAVLALRYWLLPGVERYRDDIVAAVSRTVGHPVKMGAIEAGWSGLRPQLSVSDLRIYDEGGREALVLPSVENVLSWRSLVSGQVRLHTLVIDSPRLAVRRDAKGGLHVAGMALSAKPEGGGFLEWLLAQNEIVVRDAEIEWIDEGRGAPPLALSHLELRLKNAGPRHFAGLSARPPAELGSSLDLRAEFAGRSARDLAAWTGRAYVELGYTDLAGWRPWVDYPVDLRSGQGAVRLWLELKEGELAECTADLELAGVAARLDKDLPPLELARLSGRLRAKHGEGGYEVSGEKLQLAPARGPALEPTDVRVEWRPAGQTPERGVATVSLIELEPLAQLAEALPLPAEPRRLLAELAPRGRLTQARLAWSGPLAEPGRLKLGAKFSGVSVNPSGEVPGFAGLSGEAEATDSNGRLRLDSRGVRIDAPKVLAESSVALERLEGEIEWQRPGADKLAVSVKTLAFSNADFEGKASGSYSWDGQGPGTIDLDASLQRADGSKVARYLPGLSILDAATHDWLARTVVDGRSSNVALKLKGDLRDFPFVDPAKGLFRVAAHVENGVLDYAAGWPRIEDVDADLLFEADRMEISARSAGILGARVAATKVSIPSFFAPSIHLLVDGQAEGPTGEFLKYVETSPVSAMIGGGTDGMRAVGNGKLALRLDLPLGQLAAAKVQGRFEFASNEVTVPYANLPPVERAQGKVSFSEKGFALEDLKGRVFGGPLSVSGGTRAGRGTEIVAKGEARVAGLKPIFSHPWERYLNGALSYTTTITVQERRGVRVVAESNLRGVSSVLPPPFAKRASETLPLRIYVHPEDARGHERISVKIGKLAAVEVRRRHSGKEMTDERAAVALTPGAGELKLPEKPGLLIYGSLDSFDADRWLPLLTEEGVSGAGGAPTQGAAGGDKHAPVTLDLRARRFEIYGKRIHRISLRAATEAGGWTATAKSDEITGDLSYRTDDGGKLVARLANLRVPKDYLGARSQEETAQAKSALEAGRSRDLPALDLIAERFAFQDKELGRLELVARRDSGDWRLDKVALASPEATVNGKGLWHPDSPARTSLELDLDSSDAGRFLARLGYPGLVRGGKAKMQAAVSWAGDPSAIDYPSLTGELQLQAEDGQFLEVDPGLGKLVSLMSLQALPKRLTLDFRDVFSKGFQFDRIASAARVERGVLTIHDFKMRGSAADVEMAGEVDLAGETQNLTARVLPALGDSASAALVFVNPLFVIPAAIAQRILKDPLSHIFAFNYSITGTWANPEVAKRSVEPSEANSSRPPAGANN